MLVQVVEIHMFFVGTENDLGLVWFTEIDFFCVGSRVDFISVCGIGIDLTSMYGSELTWFRVGVRS